MGEGVEIRLVAEELQDRLPAVEQHFGVEDFDGELFLMGLLSRGLEEPARALQQLRHPRRVVGGKGAQQVAGRGRAQQPSLPYAGGTEHAADLGAARRANHDPVTAAQCKRGRGIEHADGAALTEAHDELVGGVGSRQQLGNGTHDSPSVSRMI